MIETNHYYYDPTTGQLTYIYALTAECLAGKVHPTADMIAWNYSDPDPFSACTSQTTQYVYDAAVVEDDGAGGLAGVSANKSWISAVYYPDHTNWGQTEPAPSVSFQYRSDGLVAKRTDGRGVELVYKYDARDRLREIEVTAAPVEVDSTVSRVTYSYTPDGMLTLANVFGPGGSLGNDLTFTYGGYQQLTGADQVIWDVAGLSKSVTYAWDTATANSFRLDGITYPDAIGQVGFDYGAPGSIDDALNRLTSILDPADGVTELVGYSYMGTGRQVGLSLNAGAITRDYTTGGVATGLDRFGRVIDIPYEAGADTLLRFQYGYDARGNRTFAEVTGLGDDRSWLYGYDDLNRLVRASRGMLNATRDGFETDAETTLWNLDVFGNWTGRGSNWLGVMRFADVDGDGQFSVATDKFLEVQDHGIRPTNEIDTRIGAWGMHVYDEAGNLIFDNDYYYVYDAFNRLTQVHEPGALQVAGPRPDDLSGTPGPRIALYSYDALGRRIKTVEGDPATGLKTTRHVYGGGAEVLAEYDVSTDGAGGYNEALARWFVHGSAFPDPLVMVDVSAPGDPPATGPGNPRDRFGVDPTTGDPSQTATAVEYLYFYLKDALGCIRTQVDELAPMTARRFHIPCVQGDVLAGLGRSLVSVSKTDTENANILQRFFALSRSVL